MAIQQAFGGRVALERLAAARLSLGATCAPAPTERRSDLCTFGDRRCASPAVRGGNLMETTA
jgi:hypothetical protein